MDEEGGGLKKDSPDKPATFSKQTRLGNDIWTRFIFGWSQIVEVPPENLF